MHDSSADARVARGDEPSAMGDDARPSEQGARRPSDRSRDQAPEPTEGRHAESKASRDELVLVLAPTGRDTPLTCSILTEWAEVACEPCADIDDLCRGIAAGAGAVVLAEEALDPGSARRLIDTIFGELAWSDLPVLLLTETGGDVTSGGVQLSVLRQRLNVTLLERPLRISTLVSSVQSALRARRRQYEVRDLLTQTRDAVRQRDQFLAMLGHELRNPLGTITNSMTVIDELCPPHSAPEAEQRDMIHRQTRHLARLVDDLLDVSRITSGKIVLRKQRLDLVELVHGACRGVQGAARARGHRLECKMPDQPLPVLADSVRLEQVVTNLLTNAIKYTPEGGEITVALQSDEARSAARLIVRDNGIGIPADLLPRVFDLFTQAERAPDRAQGGLGIGLTLVRSLVEMHGGAVTAMSPGPGKGTEFTVTIPLAPQSEASTAPSQQAPPAHGARDRKAPVAPAPARKRNGNPNPGGPRRSVLVVEDNRDARQVLQRLLQLWGHRVEVAEDGTQGIRLAEQIRPEVALVDVGLPGIDGYDVARRIRASLGKSIRLVALTGYGQPEDRARAHEAGFDLHLVKPVAPTELAQVLSTPQSVSSSTRK